MIVSYKTHMGHMGRGSYGGEAMFYCFDSDGRYHSNGPSGRSCSSIKKLNCPKSRQYMVDWFLAQEGKVIVVTCDVKLETWLSREVRRIFGGTVFNLQNQWSIDCMRQCKWRVEQLLDNCDFDLMVHVAKINGKWRIVL